MMNVWQTFGTVSLLTTSLLPWGILQPRVAQAQDLTGACRQVSDSQAMIYAERSTFRMVENLSRGDEVILAEPGPIAGWIAVSTPTPGFVEERYLVPCGAIQQPNFPGAIGNTCINYRVSQTEGLPIRQSPSRTSAAIDRVYPTERVNVIGQSFFNPQTQTEWLEINFPVPGWIENGRSDDRTFNTTPCSELGM